MMMTLTMMMMVMMMIRQDRRFDPQLFSQCGSTYTFLNRSVPEIH